jgi:hypothetical protein
MQAPADKTVKRLSVEEWFARYDALDLLKAKQQQQHGDRKAQRTAPPADRIAVRA